MGWKYPVISISLKGIDAQSYETAHQMTARVIIEAAAKFYHLLDSERLNDYDKSEYRKLLDDNMNERMLGSSLRLLSEVPWGSHYTKAVLLCIDMFG